MVVGLREYAWGFHPVGEPLYTLVPVSVAFGFVLSIFVLADVVRSVWIQRTNRYSELRSSLTPGADKIKMSYIGG